VRERNKKRGEGEKEKAMEVGLANTKREKKARLREKLEKPPDMKWHMKKGMFEKLRGGI